jgi:cardiolipin synthase
MVVDKEFAAEVEEMLKTDFAASRQISAADFNSKSFLFRFAVRTARLLSPIQ